MKNVNNMTICPLSFSSNDLRKCNDNCALYENKECKLATALEKIGETKEKESV